MPITLSKTIAITRNTDDAVKEASKEEKHPLHVQIPKSLMRRIRKRASESDCTVTAAIMPVLEDNF